MSITESLRYGAAELKRFYNRNLALALLVSVGLHLGLIGLYIVTANLQAHDEPSHGPRESGPHFPIFVDPPTQDHHPSVGPTGPSVQPRTGDGGQSGTFGKLVPTSDLRITDSTSIATFDNLSIAPSQPGNGTGSGPDGDSSHFGSGDVKEPVTMNITKAEEIPSTVIFIAVEKEPEFDLDELNRRVKYPEIARRNGIEGRVVVQAYIDKSGRVARTQIVQSDNKVLEAAAVEAVMATRFAPAIQNGSPIGVWIAIPISFRLQ